jgi:hypothetical protein
MPYSGREAPRVLSIFTPASFVTRLLKLWPPAGRSVGALLPMDRLMRFFGTAQQTAWWICILSCLRVFALPKLTLSMHPATSSEARTGMRSCGAGNDPQVPCAVATASRSHRSTAYQTRDVDFNVAFLAMAAATACLSRRQLEMNSGNGCWV